MDFEDARAQGALREAERALERARAISARADA
jgi:hypothetical protein